MGQLTEWPPFGDQSMRFEFAAETIPNLITVLAPQKCNLLMDKDFDDVVVHLQLSNNHTSDNNLKLYSFFKNETFGKSPM